MVYRGFGRRVRGAVLGGDLLLGVLSFRWVSRRLWVLEVGILSVRDSS